VQSLALQGGPFSEDAARDFEQSTWRRDAMQLRRWDDAAKAPGLAVPVIDAYRELLSQLQLP
jgi:predicted HD phosphohydrolase